MAEPCVTVTGWKILGQLWDCQPHLGCSSPTTEMMHFGSMEKPFQSLLTFPLASFSLSWSKLTGDELRSLYKQVLQGIKHYWAAMSRIRVTTICPFRGTDPDRHLFPLPISCLGWERSCKKATTETQSPDPSEQTDTCMKTCPFTRFCKMLPSLVWDIVQWNQTAPQHSQQPFAAVPSTSRQEGMVCEVSKWRQQQWVFSKTVTEMTQAQHDVRNTADSNPQIPPVPGTSAREWHRSPVIPPCWYTAPL